MWRTAGELEKGTVSGESFLSFPSHWPSRPYSDVSRHLKVEKDARLKAQTRCSSNSTVRLAQ